MYISQLWFLKRSSQALTNQRALNKTSRNYEETDWSKSTIVDNSYFEDPPVKCTYVQLKNILFKNILYIHWKLKQVIRDKNKQKTPLLGVFFGLGFSMPTLISLDFLTELLNDTFIYNRVSQKISFHWWKVLQIWNMGQNVALVDLEKDSRGYFARRSRFAVFSSTAMIFWDTQCTWMHHLTNQLENPR